MNVEGNRKKGATISPQYIIPPANFGDSGSYQGLIYKTIKISVHRKMGGYFLLVPLGVEINPQFYWGKKKGFSKAKNGALKAAGSC